MNSVLYMPGCAIPLLDQYIHSKLHVQISFSSEKHQLYLESSPAPGAPGLPGRTQR